MSETDLPTFTSNTWYDLPKHGRVYITTLDREMADCNDLRGQIVLIDGERYHCRAVECFLHMPPWRKGEWIGLLVSGHWNKPDAT